MTELEFKKWFTGHRNAFPAIDGWLDELTRRKLLDGTAPLKQSDILNEWFICIRPVTLAGAKEATRLMLKGETEKPIGFGDHPRVVLATSRKLAAASGHKSKPFGPKLDRDNNEVFKCKICRDYGWTLVWHPTTVRLAREGKWHPPAKCYVANTCCNCEAGDRRAAQKAAPDRYDPARYCLVSSHHPTSADEQALLDWIETSQDEQTKGMANYDPALAEYNSK